jgi:hypothetical protein
VRGRISKIRNWIYLVLPAPFEIAPPVTTPEEAVMPEIVAPETELPELLIPEIAASETALPEF